MDKPIFNKFETTEILQIEHQKIHGNTDKQKTRQTCCEPFESKQKRLPPNRFCLRLAVFYALNAAGGSRQKKAPYQKRRRSAY